MLEQDEPTTRTEAGDIEQIDDLSKIIYGALDGDEGAEETPEVESAPEDDVSRETRSRDEKGRFKAADDSADEEPEEDKPEAAAPEDQATELEASDEATEAEPERPAWDDGHFRGWEPDVRERFNALPPEQQQAVMEFKQVSDAALTRTSQEFSEYRKKADDLVQLADEIGPMFAASGQSVPDLVKGYVGIEKTLSYGTLDEKLQLIGQIAQHYGIPLDVNNALPWDADIDQLRAVHDRDSRIAREQSETAQLRAELDQLKQQQLYSTVESFRNATNADGSPKYPHFELVRGAMAQYMQTGMAESLEDAYQKASKPIEDRLQAEIDARLAKQTASQQQAVEKAKRAAPVKRSPPSALNGHTAAPQSIDDVINSALDSAGF